MDDGSRSRVWSRATGIWDAALGNTALGFGNIDPRTNREMFDRAKEPYLGHKLVGVFDLGDFHLAFTMPNFSSTR